MIKDKFNIVWYVLCWNEMPVLPFMIDYWKQIARKVIVFDNNSTDGSIEYLSTFDWIEVRPYPINTNNELNDEIHYKIKNDCWKEQKNNNVDFVIVSDLDEIIWAKNLEEHLSKIKSEGYSVIKPTAYDFVSLTFPIKGDMLLHEQIETCYRLPFWDKCIIFDPNLVDEINYDAGAHHANPKTSGKLYNVENLYLFHFKYLSLEYLIIKRFATKNRMSETNKNHNWGFEYNFNKDQISEQFFEKWTTAKHSKRIRELL